MTVPPSEASASEEKSHGFFSRLLLGAPYNADSGGKETIKPSYNKVLQ